MWLCHPIAGNVNCSRAMFLWYIFKRYFASIIHVFTLSCIIVVDNRVTEESIVRGVEGQCCNTLLTRRRNEPIVVAARRSVGQHMGAGVILWIFQGSKNNWNKSKWNNNYQFEYRFHHKGFPGLIKSTLKLEIRYIPMCFQFSVEDRLHSTLCFQFDATQDICHSLSH